MTKVIILCEATPEKPKKPIEFVQRLNSSNLMFSTITPKPKQYANIELICKNYTNEFDLMFAYDVNRSNGVLFVGHFNDGFVK